MLMISPFLIAPSDGDDDGSLLFSFSSVSSSVEVFDTSSRSSWCAFLLLDPERGTEGEAGEIGGLLGTRVVGEAEGGVRGEGGGREGGESSISIGTAY
jgi:hypothetical protein